MTKRRCFHGLPQYSIKLRAGRLQDFVSLLNSLTPVVAKHGWKLLGSYATVVGRLNTVVDLWGAAERGGNSSGDV